MTKQRLEAANKLEREISELKYMISFFADQEAEIREIKIEYYSGYCIHLRRKYFSLEITSVDELKRQLEKKEKLFSKL